ncbi:MAG: PRC-barrel protein [Gemmatimonadetes bacterium]|nr:PRC-barrel protein [Gemmatimonadota bacterium]
MREVRVHLLIGARVRDANGVVVGRIEELCAEIVPPTADAPAHYAVTQFQLGPDSLLERVLGAQFARGVRAMFHATAARAIPWEWMDLRDPNNPVVTKRLSELPFPG